MLDRLWAWAKAVFESWKRVADLELENNKLKRELAAEREKMDATEASLKRANARIEELQVAADAQRIGLATRKIDYSSINKSVV